MVERSVCTNFIPAIEVMAGFFLMVRRSGQRWISACVALIPARAGARPTQPKSAINILFRNKGVGARANKCQYAAVSIIQSSFSILQRLSLLGPATRRDVLTQDYWPAVETMIEADVGSKAEMVLRFAVVGFGALFMTLATGRFAIALWLSAFLLANGYYSWRLSRIAAPVTAATYFVLKALFAISVTLYSTCTIYLFLIGTPAFVTIAIAALIAQALFNISRHRQSSVLVVYDTAVVALTGLFFGLSSINKTDGSFAEEMVIIVSTVGVCCYYVIAQIRKIQIHDALQASRQEAVQTQKMRAVGQLTAGVAHEFNNLLTVIRGNIELAQLSDDPRTYQERLNDAIKAADRADALTSQLLSLSRKARLEAAVIDQQQFWSDFEKIIPRITAATVTVDVTTSPDAKTLYCDINQLEVALINLIVNARDAINGRGNIWISSQAATPTDLSRFDIDTNTPLCVIEIRDNGPGIPPHQLHQVIEPFFTTKGVGQGTGLGLPMVKGFCEQSGGGFLIDSDNTGTTVRLALPMTNARDRAA